MADPSYKGYLFYALEIGGALAAILLTIPRASSAGWVLALGVSVGPASGYILSRSIGLPHYAEDIGNWTEPLGLASLLVEGLLFICALTSLIADHRVAATELDAVVQPARSSKSPESTFSPPIPAPRTHEDRGTDPPVTDPAPNRDWGALQEILAQLDDLTHRVIRLEEATGHRRPVHSRAALGDWVPSGGRRDGPHIDRTRPGPPAARTSATDYRTSPMW